MSRKHSETIKSLQLQSQTNSSIYDCKDIGLISSHNAVYALTLVCIQYPNKAWFYPLILPKVIFSAVLIDHILMRLIIVWNLLSCETRTKRKTKTKKQKQTGSCRMSDALRGVVWSSASYTAAARQIQSLLSRSCALYEGVLLLLSSSCPSEHFMTVPWL